MRTIPRTDVGEADPTITSPPSAASATAASLNHSPPVLNMRFKMQTMLTMLKIRGSALQRLPTVRGLIA